MIFGFAAFDEERNPGDHGHDNHGDCGGKVGDGGLNHWLHGEPKTLAFHDFRDMDAVVAGFWKGLFSLFNVFFIDLEFLDAGVFPDVVLQLRFRTEHEGGVDGGVLQFEGTELGDFVRGNNSFV